MSGNRRQGFDSFRNMRDAEIHVALWCMGHHGTMSDNALLAVVIIVIEAAGCLIDRLPYGSRAS